MRLDWARICGMLELPDGENDARKEDDHVSQDETI